MNKLKRHSKTIWWHVASAAVAISTVGLVYVNQLELTALQAMILAMGFTLAQLFGGIWLRTLTKTAIGGE